MKTLQESLKNSLNESLKGKLYKLAGYITGHGLFIGLFGDSVGNLVKKSALNEFNKIMEELVRLLDKHSDDINNEFVNDINRMKEEHSLADDTSHASEKYYKSLQYCIENFEVIMKDWPEEDLKKFLDLYEEAIQIWEASIKSVRNQKWYKNFFIFKDSYKILKEIVDSIIEKRDIKNTL